MYNFQEFIKSGQEFWQYNKVPREKLLPTMKMDLKSYRYISYYKRVCGNRENSLSSQASSKPAADDKDFYICNNKSAKTCDHNSQHQTFVKRGKGAGTSLYHKNKDEVQHHARSPNHLFGGNVSICVLSNINMTNDIKL